MLSLAAAFLRDRVFVKNRLNSLACVRSNTVVRVFVLLRRFDSDVKIEFGEKCAALRPETKMKIG